MIISEDAIFVLRTIAAIPTVGSAFERSDDGESVEVRGLCIEGARHFITATIIDRARSAVVLLDATSQ